jgi:hypothetical protein
VAEVLCTGDAELKLIGVLAESVFTATPTLAPTVESALAPTPRLTSGVPAVAVAEVLCIGVAELEPPILAPMPMLTSAVPAVATAEALCTGEAGLEPASGVPAKGVFTLAATLPLTAESALAPMPRLISGVAAVVVAKVLCTADAELELVTDVPAEGVSAPRPRPRLTLNSEDRSVPTPRLISGVPAVAVAEVLCTGVAELEPPILAPMPRLISGVPAVAVAEALCTGEAELEPASGVLTEGVSRPAAILALISEETPAPTPMLINGVPVVVVAEVLRTDDAELKPVTGVPTEGASIPAGTLTLTSEEAPTPRLRLISGVLTVAMFVAEVLPTGDAEFELVIGVFWVLDPPRPMPRTEPTATLAPALKGRFESRVSTAGGTSTMIGLPPIALMVAIGLLLEGSAVTTDEVMIVAVLVALAAGTTGATEVTKETTVVKILGLAEVTAGIVLRLPPERVVT